MMEPNQVFKPQQLHMQWFLFIAPDYRQVKHLDRQVNPAPLTVLGCWFDRFRFPFAGKTLPNS